MFPKNYSSFFPWVFPQASLGFKKTSRKNNHPVLLRVEVLHNTAAASTSGVRNGGKSRSAGDFNVSNKQQEKNRHKKQRKKQTTWKKNTLPPPHKKKRKKHNTPQKESKQITGGTPHTPQKKETITSSPGNSNCQEALSSWTTSLLIIGTAHVTFFFGRQTKTKPWRAGQWWSHRCFEQDFGWTQGCDSSQPPIVYGIFCEASVVWKCGIYQPYFFKKNPLTHWSGSALESNC